MPKENPHITVKLSISRELLEGSGKQDVVNFEQQALERAKRVQQSAMQAFPLLKFDPYREVHLHQVAMNQEISSNGNTGFSITDY